MKVSSPFIKLDSAFVNAYAIFLMHASPTE